MNMGTWGTKLYENDFAKDVRADYANLLALGKADAEALEELIAEYSNVLGTEDEMLFWFALADTQWDFGRLQALVKQKALSFASEYTDERWSEKGSSEIMAWNNTVQRLKEKLLTDPPNKKQVRNNIAFHCQWPLGAVFAYRFNSDFSKERGCFDRYIVFQKVSEDAWYPNHIIPVVVFYRWVGNYMPSIEEVRAMELLPVYSPKEFVRREKIGANLYKTSIITEAEKEIPLRNLHYLGVLGENKLTPFQGFNYWTGNRVFGWESSKGNWKIEHSLIRLLKEWNVELST